MASIAKDLGGQRRLLFVGPDKKRRTIRLGPLTSVGNSGTPGTLVATKGVVVEFGKGIEGYGTISTPNDPTRPLINNGLIQGDSAANQLTLTGYVKGVGAFTDVDVTGTFAPGLSPTKVQLGG